MGLIFLLSISTIRAFTSVHLCIIEKGVEFTKFCSKMTLISPCIIVNLYSLFILHLVVYSFFTYLRDEGREWMVVVVCEEREKKLIKKKRKIKILMKWCVK